MFGSDNKLETVPQSAQIDLGKYERQARLKLNEYECKIWAELEPTQVEMLNTQK